MQQKTQTDFSVNREKLEVTLSRVFDAPRALVYQTVTDPALMGQWWGPAYLTTQVEHYDVHVGGEWRMIQSDADGNTYAFHGEFREVVPPERLVYTFIFEGAPEHEVIETMHLEDLNGKTRLTTTDVFATAEALEGMVMSGMESGAVESMERLAILVEGK